MENDRIYLIIEAYLDGSATAEEIAGLVQWLAADSLNAGEFARLGMLHRNLTDHFKSRDNLLDTSLTIDGLSETMILPAIGLPAQNEESPLQQLHQHHTFYSPAEPHVWRGRKPNPQAATAAEKPPKLRWRQNSTLAAAAILVLLLIGLASLKLLIKPQSPPKGPIPGRISETVNAQWAAGEAGLSRGSEGIPRNGLYLTSGLVQVTLSSGISIVLQGPTSFRFRSRSHLELIHGKVSVNVPHTAIGYSVYTPDAVVTDLGTDFGVIAKRSGKNSSVVVFKGRVVTQQRSRNIDKSPEKAQIITQGQAATVRSGGMHVYSAANLHVRFIRSLTRRPLKLSLVDLMCGGNGLGIGGSVEIDPLTGRSGHLPPVGGRPGNGFFHPVKDIPIVDGCFVPGGGKGSNKIDSAGQTYTFHTSVDGTFGNISAGGSIPWLDSPPTVPVSTLLRGVNYSLFPHSLVVIHSNSGLTLSLNYLHKLYPAMRIRSFQCLVGDSFKGTDKYADVTNPTASIHVLVDGREVYHRLRFSGLSAPFRLNIPLPAHAHFLTLVTTDGDDGYTDNWVLWCDPHFLAAPAKH